MMLPKPPRRKYDEVCQTATKERGRVVDGGGEPVEEFSIRAEQSVRGSAPHEHLVPDLAEEGASSEEVLHRLQFLVIKEAERSMMEARAREPIDHPSTTLDHKLEEDQYGGAPKFLGETPRGGGVEPEKRAR